MASNTSKLWKISRLSGLLTACLLLWASAAMATTRYVATNGSNSWPGTQSQPWRSIEHAMSNVNPGDVVRVQNGTYFPATTIVISDYTISLIANGNSVVIDGSNLPAGEEIISIYEQNNVVIDGFEIRNGPHRGMSITGTGLTIKDCHIHHNLEQNIFGWFLVGSTITGNDIHHSGQEGTTAETKHNIYLAKGCRDVIVENNYIHEATEQGLHVNGNLPGGTPPHNTDGINTGIIVRNNIFENNQYPGNSLGGDFMNTHDSFLYNNLFINNVWYLLSQPDVPTNSNGNVVANNTFVVPDKTHVLKLFGPSTGQKTTFAWANNNYVFNNIMLTKDGAAAIVNDGTNNRIGFNHTVTYTANVAQSLFQDYQNDDYRIKSGSAVHDQGTAFFNGMAAPSQDFDGQARPMGGGFDIGADEFLEGVAPQPPIPPQGLQISETTPGTVALSWQSNSEPDIAGYVVYYGPVSVAGGSATQYANSVNVGNTTSWSQGGFAEDTWYFAVRAYNGVNDFSGYSSEVSIDVNGQDNVAPILSGASPGNGATNVSVGANILFALSDAQAGVDTNSVSVTIGGGPPAKITFVGDPSSYAVICEPNGPLASGAFVQVSVSAQDLAASPNVMSANWSFSTVTVANDVTAPLISGIQPADGAIDVSRDTGIFFVLSDGESGVDTNSVSVLVNGVAPVSTSFLGLPSSYAVVCDLGGTLPANSTVNVSISATDLATSPNAVNASWSFVTEDTASVNPDTAPPTLSGLRPADGETDVALDEEIIFVLSDAHSGVDTNSVSVMINGGPPATTLFFGVPSSYVVICTPAGPLKPGTTINMSVTAADLAAPSNTMSANWSFDTEAAASDTEPPVILAANPTGGAGNVARDTKIFFVLMDEYAGVDTNSVFVSINGLAPQSISYVGDPSNYAVVCEPNALLPANTQIDVFVSVTDYASPGNQSQLTWSFTTGNSTVTTPTGLVAQGTSVGCAQLAWNTNPESNIVGYTIYYGPSSVAQGQVLSYQDSVEVDNRTNRTICGLTDGQYFFALRARSDTGLISGYSIEVWADVTNGSVQGPLPPQEVAVSEDSPDCVTVSWVQNAEPDLQGYVVYYGPTSVSQGNAAQYSDSVDVQNVTSTVLCNFGPSTQYFALRAYNTGGEFSGYSTERALNVLGPDVTAPVLSDANPASGALDVPRNTNVFFVLSDNQAGVDTNTVSVTLDGSPAADITFLGSPSRYLVLATAAGDFQPHATVTVSVSASDLASTPNAMNVNWSFFTGSNQDRTPPVFCCQDPVADSEMAHNELTIRVGISDDETGVDLSHINFRVDGLQVSYSVIGDSRSAVIEYESPNGLAAGLHQISIVAEDFSGNSAVLNYSFSILGGRATVPTPTKADIIPNGYWADDPARPLEVRNLPAGWAVRIFDVAGSEIKEFRNDQNVYIDWTWAFDNKHGRRVSRSLYLIRVVDDTGIVRSTGRFLVQSDG